MVTVLIETLDTTIIITLVLIDDDDGRLVVVADGSPQHETLGVEAVL